jgi:hypothetical protein
LVAGVVASVITSADAVAGIVVGTRDITGVDACNVAGGIINTCNVTGDFVILFWHQWYWIQPARKRKRKREKR